MTKIKNHIKEHDQKLVKIVKDFSMLGTLSWQKSIMKNFLNDANKGKLKLPKVEYENKDYTSKIQEIENYLIALGEDEHPAINFLRDTANSYKDGYRIINGAGTQDVTEFSKKLYGSPKDIVDGYKWSSLKMAHKFLKIIDEYKYTIKEEARIYTASEFRVKLKKIINESIDPILDPVDVKIDSKISAKAASTSEGIKVRIGARFSKNDLHQLFHHEVMIHALTRINGKKQPVLSILEFSSPRTTATQEGLATFAEYINMSMELTRLKRIVLRIVAIDMAENGADFIEIFKFFCTHGQTHEESYFSAMRIFRGGFAEGGIVFYKDVVYLKGLIEINSFLKTAVHKGIIHDISLLFCGKLTTNDVLIFKSILEEGLISEPAYMPEWAKDASILASHLAINDLTGKFSD